VALEDGSSKGLGERVGGHVCSRAIVEGNITIDDAFAEAEETEVDVLGLGSVGEGQSHLDATLIVFEDDGGRELGAVKVGKETTDPDSFVGCVGGSNKLRLAGGTGRTRLLFGGPGDSVVAEVVHPAGNGFASVGVLGPIGVGEATENEGRGRGGGREGHNLVGGATQVPEEMFGMGHVRWAGVLDVATEGLNCKPDVGARGSREMETDTHDGPIGDARGKVRRRGAVG
jgi:hypothetical protein